MILRKPFAFLIKHFRSIHAIMAMCLFYLVYKSNNLMNFLNDYVVKQTNYIGSEITDTLFDVWMFVFPVLIILSSIIVMGLLINKKKPFKFYIINILSSIFVIVFYVYAQSTIGKLELQVIDIRVMRAVRDISIAVFAGQLLSTIITVVRATGFDIQQFGFKKDIKELKINEADREEVEVDFNIDTDKTKRGLRRYFRFGKYFYLENKLAINVCVCFVLLFGVSSYFKSTQVEDIVYTTTEYFMVDNFNMRIEDAYITNTDSSGKVIANDGKSLIVLRLKIKKEYSDKEKLYLDIAKTELKVGEMRYYPVLTYRDKLKDIGITYEDQLIEDDYKYYLLTYDVHNEYLENSKVVFNYISDIVFNDGPKIELKLNNLNNDLEDLVYQITDEIKFDNSILKDSSLIVSKVKINNIFTNTYKSCIKDECIDFYEYVKPSISDNFDKTLIELTWDLNKSDVVTTSNFNSLFNIIKTFGELEYITDGVSKKQVSGFKEVKPLKTSKPNVTYLEVVKEIESAQEAYINLNIRNQTYKIKIK